MSIRSYRLLGVVLLAAGATPSAASLYSVRIDTTAVRGTAGALVFDLTSSNAVPNSLTILNFTHDGTDGLPETEGGLVQGDIILGLNPAPFTSIADGSFFNELLVPFTAFGNSITFTLQVSQAPAGPGASPDEVSLFLLDGARQPLFPTADPLGADALFALCIDGSASGQLSVFAPTRLVSPGSLEVVVGGATAPPPPAGPWLSTAAIPGFRAKVRITSGSVSIAGAQEGDCIEETLCVSGALPGRPEVFIRVIGPKPNGWLWPTIVKFTTSQAEVWIEQTATEALQYYQLAAVNPGDEILDLKGLAHKLGFLPAAQLAAVSLAQLTAAERGGTARAIGGPPPPAGPWLETAAVPGFRVKVRVTSGPETINGARVSDCIQETLCVSGAVAGRAEVFVRVLGPKPNGKLWPTIVKFSTSQIETWIEQRRTGIVQYYALAAVTPGEEIVQLDGLADKNGFNP